MTTQFNIEKVSPRRDANVDVHVRWDGGAEIFVFPKAYPSSTILAQIKIELRRREVESDVTHGDKYRDLIGKHDV